MKRRYFGKRLDKKVNIDNEHNNFFNFLMGHPVRNDANKQVWSMRELAATNKQARKTYKNPKGYSDEDIY